MVLDKAMKAKEESTSAAPAMAQTTAAVKDTKKVAAESETLASTSSREVIATQKKKRNPDVRKLSQSRHLMKLLRPAAE
jgi:4-hydroxy-3-methylbut-2-enyl diphosphate reductase IspH